MNIQKYGTATGLLAIVVIAMSTPLIANSEPVKDWQLRKLLIPSNQDIQFEQDHQKVFIYDGLYSKDIEKALNGQFDRIENMMFVRVKVASENGVAVIDDNCDD